MRSFLHQGATALMAVFLCFAAHVCFAAGPEFVWIEGENPAAVNVKGPSVTIAGWGHKEFLSQEKWFQVSIDEGKVDQEAPADGVLIRYAFEASKAASYEVWNRIGYEFARSRFDWRIDEGEWATVKPDDLTIDLMEVDTWNEVAWLKMGDRTLPAGRHTLEIRLPKTKDDKGKTQRILYASDALCLTAGKFTPNSRFKPHEDGRTLEDIAAGKNVFRLPDAAVDGTRTTLPLAGAWEVCRNDEQAPPPDVAVPMQDFPSTPQWSAIKVPGDKNELRPDLLFAHRLWYRTRVNVPKSHAGHSLFLTFPRNSLNTTVYVNGVYCGFEKNPNVTFSIDVTKGIKPGQVNEIRVGIRDAWYGYSTNPNDPMKLRRKFNLPVSVAGQGFQDLAYPVWHAWQSGIVQTPTLTSAGPIYASDVFVKPNVANKEIGADITLTNSGGAVQHAAVEFAAVNAKTGRVVKTWPAASSAPEVSPGKSAQVAFAGPWPDVKLWWPEPEPQLYVLRCTVAVGGRPVDIAETRFGFREWGQQGKDFTLNGIVWHGWADLNAGNTPQEWLANYRKTNQRFMRLSGYAQGGPDWHGLTPSEALDIFDENGVVVRRSGDLDGEAIGYMAVENDPDLVKKYGTDIKQQLIDNWRDQMVAQVKAERNHPSVMLWSIENEWLYINCINLYGDKMDAFERAEAKVMDAVRQSDPTRLVMADGGGAGKDNLFPIHGDHYVFGDMTKYPALAYEANPAGGGRGRWVWDQKRPRFIGEDFYASGINPFNYAYFGGEETFIGKTNTRRAAGLIQRMLTEGYRWAGYGAWHFWLGAESAVDQYGANAPLAVFCREWDATFGAGQKVKRTVGIFNDTFDDDPITFTWTLTVGGKKIVSETMTTTVPPGENKKLEVLLPFPTISGTRAEGEWTLTLATKGQERFRDVKSISLLQPRRSAADAHLASLGRPSSAKGGAAATAFLVYDPQGSAVAYLKAQGIGFTPLARLADLPQNGRLLLVGKDALTPEESTSSHLAAWASAGRRIVVLEQRNPLRYQGLPGAMEPSQNEGRTAFAEDENHPVFANLKQKDLFTWGEGEIVYRDAYEKPTRGAKSLVQCDNRLARTAVAEIPTGKGLILVSQLLIGETLRDNVVAQQLLANLLGYAASYKQEYRSVAAAVAAGGRLAKTLDAVGVTYTRTDDPLKTIAMPGPRLAVIEATPTNLKALASHLPMVERFTKAGGWILFNDLTPEGLSDYNKIAGFDHMIRPFRRERVTFPARRSPLTAGLSNADIVLSSGQKINDYNDDVYLAADAFSYVIDYDEVGSFATLPAPSYWGRGDADNDHDPYNIVNGFYSADSWKLTFTMWAGQGGKTDVLLTLPKPQEITELEWTGNAAYYPTKKVELTFDGQQTVAFDTKPNDETQTFPITPGRVGKEIDLKIADWAPVHEPPIVGIDNVRLKAKRSPEFYHTVHPLLNIGAMLAYDRGAGGIVLCNLLFQDREAVPENQRKKQNILATLLRNLMAPFRGGATVIAGAPLQYDPIEIGKQATQFRDERGWFGDKAFTFKDLPHGRQVFVGVPFQVYEFSTSPVPNAVMLGGSGIPNTPPDAVRGIPVGRTADALFFLQTARMDGQRNANEVREKKRYEMARYIVTYADGQKVNVPVYAEINIDDYKQEAPRALPGAQIAWTRKYEGMPYSAVAYVQQWDNPRPGVAIRSIDLEYGPDRRGVPVLLALTAASATTAPKK